MLARSLDAGETWAESVVDDRIVPIDRFVVFFPPFPSIAAAPDGRLDVTTTTAARTPTTS